MFPHFSTPPQKRRESRAAGHARSLAFALAQRGVLFENKIYPGTLVTLAIHGAELEFVVIDGPRCTKGHITLGIFYQRRCKS